jgi:hypothetical protein
MQINSFSPHSGFSAFSSLSGCPKACLILKIGKGLSTFFDCHEMASYIFDVTDCHAIEPQDEI